MPRALGLSVCGNLQNGPQHPRWTWPNGHTSKKNIYIFVERALQQLKIRLDACDRVTHLLLLGCWFGFADVYSILYRSPTVGGKWRAPAGNEDREEYAKVPFTPHAKPLEPQPATKCVFNLLNRMAR